MKRFIHHKSNAEILEIDIDVVFAEIRESTESEIAATTVKPVLIDKENEIMDPEAYANFHLAVDQILEIIEYYDFEIFDEYQHTSGSFPYTAEYRWIAHRKEIDADNVPKMIKLRIADHVQQFSKNRKKELSKQNQEEANNLRIPISKKKQRYKLEQIIIGPEQFETFEDAYHYVESLVHDWLKEIGVDVTEYEPLGW